MKAGDKDKRERKTKLFYLSSLTSYVFSITRKEENSEGHEEHFRCHGGLCLA
jgi:hypothetical protein